MIFAGTVLKTSGAYYIISSFEQKTECLKEFLSIA